MSEQRTDLDEVVDELRGFEAGDTVRLVTDAGSLTATVTATEWRADGAAVTFEDRDDRDVRVSTEWYGGWLAPLVDVVPAGGVNDAEAADPAPAVRRPVGTLVDVRRVAVADRTGRPDRS